MKFLSKTWSATGLFFLASALPTFAQSDDASQNGAGGAAGVVGGAIGGLISLVLIVFVIACLWKVFTKAGQPGWAAIIPIYNVYIMCKIAGRPGWWLILMLIPFVNFIIAIILSVDIAKNFGKSALFGVGLALLGIIFYPILAFGDARYQGPAAA